MMRERVQHADSINEELTDQGELINKTTKEFQEMNNSMNTGRGIVAMLRSRDFIDKILVTLAFLFFCGVCVYIIKSRIRLLPFGLLSNWL